MGFDPGFMPTGKKKDIASISLGHFRKYWDKRADGLCKKQIVG